MAIKASANITLVYVSDGTGYTVLLSNESYAFAAGTSAALAGSTSSNVVAYKNTSKVAATITKIGNSAVSGNSTGVATGITGLTADVSGNGTTTCKITFKATTALTAKNGIVTIAITVDGRAFTKDFTFSLAIKGETGQTGPQGPEGKPTGVIVSATEPSTKFDGMLWKHTGTVSGLTKDVTYRWTGTKWETYLLAATNIETESLSALSADLGTVTAGNIKIPWSVPIGGNRRYEGNTILSKSQGGQNPLMFLWDVIETSTTSPTETVISKGNYARFDYRGMTLYDGSKVYNVDKNFVDTLEQLNRNLEYKTYTPTSVNANIGNKSIIVKANAYDCKINGFLYLNPATYDNDTILFQTPLKPTGTIYFSTTVAGRGFKVMTDGSVRANGVYTVSAGIYVYFGVSFAIA